MEIVDELIKYVHNDNNEPIRLTLSTIYEDYKSKKGFFNHDENICRNLSDYVYAQIKDSLAPTAPHCLPKNFDVDCLIYHTTLSAIKNENDDLIKWLIKITNNLCSDKKYADLVNAIKNNPKLAQFIIKINNFLIQPDCKLINSNYKGITPLCQAVESDNLDMIRLLLENKADPEFSLDGYSSPSQLASISNKPFASLLLNPDTPPLTILLNAMQNKKAFLISEGIHKGAFNIHNHHTLPSLQNNRQEPPIFKSSSYSIFTYVIEYQKKLLYIHVPQQLMTYLFDYLMPFRLLNTAENNILGKNSGGVLGGMRFFLGTSAIEKESEDEVFNSIAFQNTFPDQDKENLDNSLTIFAGFYISSDEALKNPIIVKPTTTINDKEFSLLELFDFMCDNFPELYFAATNQKQSPGIDKHKIDKQTDEVYKKKYAAIKEREIMINSFFSNLKNPLVLNEDKDRNKPDIHLSPLECSEEENKLSKPTDPCVDSEEAQKNIDDFENKKMEIQIQFIASLKTLEEELKKLTQNDIPYKLEGQRLYNTLLSKQELFFKALTSKSTEKDLKSAIVDFRNMCQENIEIADKVMGPSWLYRIAEALIKTVVGLFAGIGMILGSIIGQGLVKSEHREKFVNTFFTPHQTDNSKALAKFKGEILGDGKEVEGILSEPKFK